MAYEAIWTAVATTTGGLAAVILAALLYSNSSRIGGIEVSFHELEEAHGRVSERLSNHIKEAGYWKNRIESNAGNIQDIRTNPRARAGSFSRTDGKKLRELVDANERRLDALELRCGKLEKHGRAHGG